MLDTEGKTLTILKILRNSPKPLGSRVIADRLKNYGIDIGERAVRYHLKLMDERELTQSTGRGGRMITDVGIEELKSTRVRNKVGLATSRIDQIACSANFDLDKRTGSIPINISFFPKEEFSKALKVMGPVCEAGFCVSDMVLVANEGETIGEFVVPEGKVALATVSTAMINSALLKSGIPCVSRFSGILQIRKRQPLRFIDLIYFSGCSLNPSELFIRAKMTSVTQAVKTGKGKILCSFREIPSVSHSTVEEVIDKLKEARLGGILLLGDANEPVCEIPPDLNQTGMVICAGLNPVAAAEEAGIETENYAVNSVMEYQRLRKLSEIENNKS